MRALFWLLILGALAVGLALAARYNDGYVLLVLPPSKTMAWSQPVSLFASMILFVDVPPDG